jgi:predicted secreted protein
MGEENKPDDGAETPDQAGLGTETVSDISTSEKVSDVPTTKIKRVYNKRKIAIFSLAGLILIAGVSAGLIFFKPKNTAQQAQPAQTTTEATNQKPQTKVEEDPLLQRFTNPTTGEVWLSQPKKIPHQGYSDGEDEYTQYYEVGTHGDKTIIISVVQAIGDYITMYEKSKDGKVALIAKPDGDAVYTDESLKSIETYLKKTISFDTTTHYDSLTLPRSLPLSNGYVLTKPVYPDLGSMLAPNVSASTTTTEIRKVGQSTIRKTETKYVDTKLTSIGYQIVTPINTVINLVYEPLQLNLEGYRWQRGSTPSDKITPISRGCGGASTAATRSDVLTDADVQEVGQSPNGQKIYELKSSSNPLLIKAYDEFIEFFKDDTSGNPYSKISKDQFIKEHGVVIFKDNSNQWLVYARDQLRPAGGCAKPVIYLYPQATKLVTVKVGAIVKISDPLYDAQKGWTVIAQPNGNLSLNGSHYDSLFWEGLGAGRYPGIVAGTVVKRDDAPAVIRQQLAAQGMNTKESNDFMTYWQDKLPTKPYIRLTWLTTEEMNQLAPLQITPRPDTLIRVFLDASGLDVPITLPSQNLQSVPRNGFTVVEWGGLANNRLF